MYVLIFERAHLQKFTDFTRFVKINGLSCSLPCSLSCTCYVIAVMICRCAFSRHICMNAYSTGHSATWGWSRAGLAEAPLRRACGKASFVAGHSFFLVGYVIPIFRSGMVPFDLFFVKKTSLDEKPSRSSSCRNSNCRRSNSLSNTMRRLRFPEYLFFFLFGRFDLLVSGSSTAN